MKRNTRSRIVLFVPGLALLMTIWSCAGDNPLEPDQPAANDVWIQADGFHPQTLTISAGTTVTWRNKDTQVHTVESGVPGKPDLEYTSPSIKPGTSWSHRYTKTGTFRYYCSIHLRTGTVIVQ